MTERERLRELNQPFRNPEHLTKPTRIRIIKAFMIGRSRAEPGEIHTIPFADARDAVALKRAEYVHD